MNLSLHRLPQRVVRRLRRVGGRVRRKAGRLRTWRHDRRLAEWLLLASGERRLVTVRTRNGLITFDSGDGIIGQWLYRNRQWEYDLTRRTGELLRRQGMLDGRRTAFVDAGANIGTTTTAFLRDRVFERSIAVEPDPSNFALLERNVRQNGLEARVLSVPIALGERRGQALLELSPNNFGDHRVRVTTADGEFKEKDWATRAIRVERLDDVLDRDDEFGLRNVGLLWIDVQGFEEHVLRGAPSLIAQNVPVEFEFWPYGLARAGTSPEAFLAFLAASFTRFIDLRDSEARLQPISAAQDLFGLYTGRDGATEILAFGRA